MRRNLKRSLSILLAAALVLTGSVTPSTKSLLSVNQALAAQTTSDSQVTSQSVSKVLSYAQQLMQQNSQVGRTTGAYTWDTESKSRSWTYYNGLMMDAFAMIDSSNCSYVDQFYAANIKTDGSIYNYTSGELDSVEPIRAVFDLFARSDYTSSNTAKYKKAINTVYNNLENQVTFSNCGGNYAHKQNTDGSLKSSWSTYPISLDGIYMAQPFLMECANAIDSGKLTLTSTSGGSVSSSTIYSAVYNRMVWIYNSLYNSTTHLYDHAASQYGGTNGVSWSRSIGWYAMALVDVIDMMPEGTYKNALIQELPRLYDGLLEYQDDSTGLWYNVTAYGSSLNNNILETSGTALFAYSMMKAYNKGYVTDSRYAQAGLRAFNGVVLNKMTGSQGSYNVIDTYISSGASSNPSDYLTKQYTTNEAKGVGGLIMAAALANETSAKLEAATSPTCTALTLIGPDKTSYLSGETLDLTGLMVTAEYSDGTCTVLNASDYTVSQLPAQAGSHAITVSYEAVTASFQVEVHQASGQWVVVHEATCTVPGQKVQYCTACDLILETSAIPVTGHTLVTDSGRPATCSSTGLTDGSHCSVCNQVISAQEEIPFTDHTLVTTGYVAPTCSEYGVTGKTKCSVCGTVISKTRLIQPLGHTLIYDESVPATCTSDGLTKGSHCSVCGEVVHQQYPITSPGHIRVQDPGYAATCTHTGLTDGSHCYICGQVLEEQEIIPITNHNRVQEESKEPTCTEKGYIGKTYCSTCGEVYNQREEIPATGHTLVYDECVPATCYLPGLTKGRHCSVCGLVTNKQYVIDTTGHIVVVDSGKKASCELPGLTDGSHCYRCGITLTEQEVIPATGHTEVIDEAVSPTCSHIGYTEGSHCATCKKTLVYRQSIPKTEHRRIIVEGKPATVDSPGYTKSAYCGDCGKVICPAYTIPQLSQ